MLLPFMADMLVKKQTKKKKPMQQEIHHFLCCIRFYLSSSVKPVKGSSPTDVMTAAPTHEHQRCQETRSAQLTTPRDRSLFSIRTFL